MPNRSRIWVLFAFVFGFYVRRFPFSQLVVAYCFHWNRGTQEFTGHDAGSQYRPWCSGFSKRWSVHPMNVFTLLSVCVRVSLNLSVYVRVFVYAVSCENAFRSCVRVLFVFRLAFRARVRVVSFDVRLCVYMYACTLFRMLALSKGSSGLTLKGKPLVVTRAHCTVTFLPCVVIGLRRNQSSLILAYTDLHLSPTRSHSYASSFKPHCVSGLFIENCIAHKTDPLLPVVSASCWEDDEERYDQMCLSANAPCFVGFPSFCFSGVVPSPRSLFLTRLYASWRLAWSNACSATRRATLGGF